MPIKAKTNKIAVKDNHPNHSGDNTNNQDQSMYCVSFNTINTNVRSPRNPIFIIHHPSQCYYAQ